MSDTVRALKVDSNSLDMNLVSLQKRGYGISQILPCPESMDCDSISQESSSFNVGVNMNFMIVYIEKEAK